MSSLCKCGKPAMVGEPVNECWECYKKRKPEAKPSEAWEYIFGMREVKAEDAG